MRNIPMLIEILKEHRYYLYLAAVLIVLLMIIAPVSAFSGSGAGTSGDPYQITTTSQWHEMDGYLTSYFKLMNDIDFGGATIGYAGHSGGEFTGYLNGNGKALKNGLLPVTDGGSWKQMGLFFGKPTVNDLTLINVDGTVNSAAGDQYSWICPGGGSFHQIFVDSTSSITVTNLQSTDKIGGIACGDIPYVDQCGVMGSITVDNDVAAKVGGIFAYLSGGDSGYANRFTNSYYGGTETFTGGHTNVLHGGFGGSVAGNLGAYCYYDSDKSPGDGTGSVISKTTAQMTTQGTFTGWTFDSTHWRMSYASKFLGHPVWYTTYDVPDAPVASFTLSDTVAYQYVPVTMTDTSSNTPTSWAWSWGDGTSNSTTQSPSHTYSLPASTTTYTITLTATNAGGSGSTSHTVTFYRTPVVSFTANRTGILTGQAVAFTDTSTNTPLSWNWSSTGTGHPASQTVQNPVMVFTSANIYDITLAATNPEGTGSHTNSWYIWVVDNIGTITTPSFTTPIASGSNDWIQIDWTGGATYGTHAEIGANSYTDTTVSGLGTVTVPVPVTTSGTFDLKVRLTDAVGGYHWLNQTNAIIVTGPVTAGFSMNSSSGAYPKTVAFTDTSTGGTFASAVWNFGDGGSSTSQNPTHTFNTAGTYSVSLLWTNNAGASGYVTHDVTVTSPSGPTVTFTPNQTTGLYPLTVLFTDGTTGGVPGYTYAWTFGDGGTSTSASPTHTFTTAGYFTVTETVTDSYSHSAYHQVTIHPYAAGAPSTDFSISPSTGNAPLVITLTDMTTGSPDSWNWTLGDGNTTTTQNVTHTYAAGTFSITETTHTTGGYSSLTRSLTVLPTASIAAFNPSVSSGTAPLTVTFTDSSSYSPTSWAWDFGDGGTSTLQNPSHTYTTNGNFTVSLTENNAGGSSFISHTLLVSPSGTPSPSPNGTSIDSVHFFTNTAPALQYLPWTSAIHDVRTPASTWLGDRIDVNVNTTGITTNAGYNVDGWKLAVYKSKPYGAGYQTPVETYIIPLNAVTSLNVTINSTATFTSDTPPGDLTDLLYLFAINNTYHAGPGETDYGPGLMLVENVTVPVEYSPPNAIANWTGHGERNPYIGEPVLTTFYLNSYAGQVSMTPKTVTLEYTPDNSHYYVVPSIGTVTVTGNGIFSFTPSQAGVYYLRIDAGTEQTFQLLTVIDSAPGTAGTNLASFNWYNDAGIITTSVQDTGLVNFGFDTGASYQVHNYNALALVIQEYNPATKTWDTVQNKAWKESDLGNGHYSTSIAASHTWGQWRIKGSSVSNFYANTMSPGNTVGQYRAELVGSGPYESDIIVTSKTLTVTANLINPSNVANGTGGFLGLEASGGDSKIFFGLIIMVIAALLIFIATRWNVYGLLGGAVVGFMVSLALGLFPVWLLYTIALLGIAMIALTIFLKGGGGGGGSSQDASSAQGGGLK